MKKSVKENTIYNNVKVLNYSHNDKHNNKMYKCVCLLCDTVFITQGTTVKNDKTKSCGCLNIKALKKTATKHGMHGTNLYKRWKSMKARCNQKSYHAYARYGGRGIKVCERWEKDFMNFYNDMKDTYFEGAELDRINNNGNYTSENCRWVSHEENCNNRQKYKTNSGYTGVHKKGNSYQVNISHKRKTIYVGSYQTLEKAVVARKEFIKDFNMKHNTNYKYEEYEA